jgi:hypothetical protein
MARQSKRDTEKEANAAFEAQGNADMEKWISDDSAVAEAEAILKERAERENRTPIDAEIEEGIQEDELGALAELDTSANVRWIVTCTAPQDKVGFCGEMSTGELSIAKLASMYGPGTYKVKGVRDNGQFFRQRTVRISKAISAPAPTTPAPSSNVQDLLAILAADKAKSRDEMFKWAGILVPALAPALMKLFDHKGASLAELTVALKNMQEMSGGNKQPDPFAQFQQFAKMLELTREMQPEPEKTGTTIYDLVRDAVQTLPQILAARSAQPAASSPPASVSVTRPVTPTIAPPAPAQGGNPMMALVQWFTAQLPRLEERASKDRDPTLYADVLLDTLPENVSPREIQQLLARPDWWQLLSGFRPTITPYQSWFVELHRALTESVEEALQPLSGSAPGETDITRMTNMAPNAGEGEV